MGELSAIIGMLSAMDWNDCPQSIGVPVRNRRNPHFVPAAVLIGLWFVIQLLDFGVVADIQSGGVAYLAHIGGIIFGVLTARLFEDRRRLA